MRRVVQLSICVLIFLASDMVASRQLRKMLPDTQVETKQGEQQQLQSPHDSTNLPPFFTDVCICEPSFAEIGHINCYIYAGEYPEQCDAKCKATGHLNGEVQQTDGTAKVPNCLKAKKPSPCEQKKDHCICDPGNQECELVCENNCLRRNNLPLGDFVDTENNACVWDSGKCVDAPPDHVALDINTNPDHVALDVHPQSNDDKDGNAHPLHSTV